jgi:hypothetical protein
MYSRYQKENAMEDKTVQVTAYLLETLHGKLSAVAKAEQRSVSNMIVIAVSEFIAKPENVRKWSTNPTHHTERQVHIEDAIAAAVKPTPHQSIMKTARAQAAAVKTSKRK